MPERTTLDVVADALFGPFLPPLPPHLRKEIHPAAEAESPSHPDPDSDHQVALFDLENGPGGRFDPPDSLQLESRGLTAQTERPLPTPSDPPKQSEFWRSQTAHKFSIAAKLREAGREQLAQDLEDCHSTFTVAQCTSCGKTSKFPNRCDRHYCPECQPRLAAERRQSVEWWTKEIKQPKHVVLTLQNVPDLTRAHINEAKEALARLRKQVFTKKVTYHWQSNQPGPLGVPECERAYSTIRINTFQMPTATHHTVICTPWLGGFYGMEITNEGNGFHIHFHLLVDARSIGPVQLSAAWKEATRGFGYIVKVKDARETNYLQELTKYTVKGAQLAEWKPDQIVAFIEALDGVRTFGVFGSLYGKRTEFAEWLAELRDHKPACDCGCAEMRYYSEHEWLARDLTPTIPGRPRPPTDQNHQGELLTVPQRVDMDDRNYLR